MITITTALTFVGDSVDNLSVGAAVVGSTVDSPAVGTSVGSCVGLFADARQGACVPTVAMTMCY